MRNRPDDPLLVYVHIPKTAGTSARLALKQMFGDDAVLWNLVDFKTKDLASGELADRLDGVRAIGGHFRIDQAEMLPRAKIYAACYRDPLARAVSLFRHIERSEEHPLHSEISASLVETCANLPAFCSAIRRAQIRFLSGKPRGTAEDAIARIRSTPFYVAPVRNAARMIEDIGQFFGCVSARSDAYPTENRAPRAGARDPLLDDPEVHDSLAPLIAEDLDLCQRLDEMLGPDGLISPDPQVLQTLRPALI